MSTTTPDPEREAMIAKLMAVQAKQLKYLD
jgi:hypothetical protein